MQAGDHQRGYLPWVEHAATAIEMFAVVLLIAFILIATLNWIVRATWQRQFTDESFRRYRRRLGRALLLSLEILIAADVIRTVTLEPTFPGFATLGMLVVIRTFLSWSIVVESEGRWPWQARRTSQGEEDERM